MVLNRIASVQAREEGLRSAKIPLDKVLAKGCFWGKRGYGRVLEPAAAELALGEPLGLLSGI
jgi:hypothetical protein